ncbi:MAG: hypothetical protein ABI577_06720, partial [bacterium]
PSITSIPGPVATLSTAPTKLTPWGLFIINPVIDGKSAINPQGLPYPHIGGAATRSVKASSDAEVQAAIDTGMHVVTVPERFREGMQLQGMQSEIGGDQFVSDIAYYGDLGAVRVRSIRVTAYTPTEPVPFEVFPGHPAMAFAATFEVAGHPTLIVVPNPNTTDPADERIVAWSQGSAVYIIRTVGVFDRAALIELAIEISAREAAR